MDLQQDKRPCGLQQDKRPSCGPGEKLAEYIRDSVIGANATFLGPFGRRTVVYADYISSGRSLRFVEDFITAEENYFQ